MTLDDASEAAGVITTALTVLQAAVPGHAGRIGAAFRYACGDLAAQALSLVGAGTVFDPLRACFDQAVAAGAAPVGIAEVRSAVTALPLSGQPAIIAAGFCYCLALNAEGFVLSSVTYTSSDEVRTALTVFSAAVQAGQDWALDNQLSAQYQSLLALGAAISRDLQERAASLPRLTTYSFPRGMSSLVLAYKLYGDANRAGELRAENQVSNPAFMPASGTALSQ